MPVSKRRHKAKPYSRNRWLTKIVDANEKRKDAKPLASDRQTDIALGHHLSFEALMRCPTEEAWYDLAGNLNMALILCERGIGLEYIEDIKAAMLGMMRAKKRSETTGSLALDGGAIKALRVALEIHDQQLGVAERSELRAAAKTIVSRVKSGDVYEDFQVAEVA